MLSINIYISCAKYSIYKLTCTFRRPAYSPTLPVAPLYTKPQLITIYVRQVYANICVMRKGDNLDRKHISQMCFGLAKDMRPWHEA